MIQRADKLMYEAKGERASHIYLLRAQVSQGELVDITDEGTEGEESSEIPSRRPEGTDRSR